MSSLRARASLGGLLRVEAFPLGVHHEGCAAILSNGQDLRGMVGGVGRLQTEGHYAQNGIDRPTTVFVSIAREVQGCGPASHSHFPGLMTPSIPRLPGFIR